ncbi:hypothetical protein MPNT_110023 [Candidatus Methylacidithermus pantelleriae]|uniref:Uncharacterized protein n=1 Tax=Candidatus Methylacidithermus pantelleriae TaxID=2744239 RepID=A0A8J2BHZ9_9BACT|nr:hypothetical protein MPNT_110023 [Candidatus Methylacidithermus pantelleriae]
MNTTRDQTLCLPEGRPKPFVLHFMKKKRLLQVFLQLPKNCFNCCDILEKASVVLGKDKQRGP